MSFENSPSWYLRSCAVTSGGKDGTSSSIRSSDPSLPTVCSTRTEAGPLLSSTPVPVSPYRTISGISTSPCLRCGKAQCTPEWTAPASQTAPTWAPIRRRWPLSGGDHLHHGRPYRPAASCKALGGIAGNRLSRRARFDSRPV